MAQIRTGTADNASANMKFMRDFQSELANRFQHQPVPELTNFGDKPYMFGLGCCSHILNLIVQAGLAAILPAVSRVCNLCWFQTALTALTVPQLPM